MGFYSTFVFPRLCDFLLNSPFVEKHRHQLLATVNGEVLEVGFGTGLNLPHYPAHVRRITTVDPNPGMHRLAQRRVRRSRALGEVYRVLRPGGRLLLLEHGLSREPNVQTWQRRLNWLQMHFANGCLLDRDMRALVAALPFSSVVLEEFYLEHTPRTHGYLYCGVACK